MSILTIDVGNVTGWALASDTGEVSMTGIVSADHLPISVLAHWAQEDTHRVCIEYPQSSVVSMTATLQQAIDFFKAQYPDAHVVRPGVWKTSRWGKAAMPVGFTHKLTQHEKDAINIARWYRDYLQTHA